MTAFTQHQRLKYSPPQLFAIAADVERFPEFMPWIVESRIRRRADHTIFVEMTIAAGPLRRRFSTIGVMQPPHRIDVSSDDPMFDRFEQHWTFESAVEGGTDVHYRLHVTLKSLLLQMLLGASFAEQATATMAAFTRRAHDLYDSPSTAIERA